MLACIVQVRPPETDDDMIRGMGFELFPSPPPGSVLAFLPLRNNLKRLPSNTFRRARDSTDRSTCDPSRPIRYSVRKPPK
ncbi:hypothetical protein HYQ45_015963 [Verticillium longisporum]|uniref:Uncharacterized protein n=1 Tax=Verticillium longisporum TaxID=100787 RepID=A0A8I3AH50_VERLO|nr:hypothetical protein HYQ45_015963 [Verticillium longisporum]